MENQKFCTQIYAGSFCNIAKILHQFFSQEMFLQHSQNSARYYLQEFFTTTTTSIQIQNNLNHKFTKQTIELPDDTPEP
jgi:cytochrome b subunit of formate dehydrogenase